MRRFLILLPLICFVVACRKNAEIAANDNAVEMLKLVKITGDSADFYYTYTKDKISDVYTSRYDGDTSILYHYAHIDYYDNNYIKVTSPDQSFYYTEYYLNDSKLPLKIIQHDDSTTIGITTFFYKPGTDLLDSVNADVPFNEWYSRHFKFEYDGEDVSKISAIAPYYDSLVSDVFSYSYDKTLPNVFRQSDPLFYIYRYPFATENKIMFGEVGAWDGAMVKMFSESTCNSIIETLDGNSWGDYKLYYTTSDDGKILSEKIRDKYINYYFN